MMKPNQHRFPRYCIDPDALTKGRTLEAYVHYLGEQANDQRAAHAYLNDIRGNEISSSLGAYKSPSYFGDGGEFLRHCFFNFFGSHFYLRDVWSVNGDDGILCRDMGWDGGAVTSKEFNWARSGSPVYIQDKTTHDFEKVYRTNDRSRIMNFVASAAMDAIVQGTAHEARFILWTTGKGIHSVLDRNTARRIEVVGYDKVTDLVNDHDEFWNSVAVVLSRCGRES